MSPFWSKDPFQELEKSLGKGRVFRKPEDLALYGMDATKYRGEPVAVVLAESAQDVQETVRFAVRRGISVTPRGAGSGLSGGSVPIEGGIVISLERMNAIETIDTRTLTALVQPGVVTSELQAKVSKFRLFYPPDPSSHTISTIGGNVAENAGGLRCFKYGVTSHYVRGIEYVDADGELKTTGSFAGDSFEPDMTPLLVGSEGTLGIFTRIELQLLLLPPANATIAAYFSSRETALLNVEAIVGAGIVPSIMEYIDKLALRASAEHLGYPFNEKAEALLLIETDGREEECARDAKAIMELLRKSAIEIQSASSNEEREKLWKLRRSISPSLIRLASGRIHEDVAVPRGKIAALAREIDRVSEEAGLSIPVYGHAGDGNLHVVILFEAADSKQAETAEVVSKTIFRSALNLGGTITGEHGVGYAKRDILDWQLDGQVIGLSRKIKRIFDPQGVLNPSKLLPEQVPLQVS